MSPEGTSEDDYGWFSPQVSDDEVISKTVAGTDNLDVVPDFVSLNALKGVLEKYNRGLGGYKISGNGLVEGLIVLKVGLNLNFDIYLEDRDQYLQSK